MGVVFGCCVGKAQDLPDHIVFSQPLAGGTNQWKGDEERAGYQVIFVGGFVLCMFDFNPL